MAYKRLEEHTFTWPGIKDGLMTLGHAQFEALFAGLDWRRVRSVRQERRMSSNRCGTMTRAVNSFGLSLWIKRPAPISAARCRRLLDYAKLLG
jgi:hypothetical protein